MPRKVMLLNRLEPELIERLNRVASARNMSDGELISMAVDAYERERTVAESVVDRVAFLEKNLPALFEVIAAFGEKIEGRFSEASAVFNQKMDEASFNEKERFKSLWHLLKAELEAHDKAEEGRFHRIEPPLC